jgi:hypothetical protein
MAVVNYTKISNLPRGVQGVKWIGLGNGDTGQPFECVSWPDKSIQVLGTFGAGGNCRMEGSNMDSDTPTWATLNDPQGAALDITAASIEAVLEHSLKVRPNITAGDGTTSLDVYLIMTAKHFIS